MEMQVVQRRPLLSLNFLEHFFEAVLVEGLCHYLQNFDWSSNDVRHTNRTRQQSWLVHSSNKHPSLTTSRLDIILAEIGGFDSSLGCLNIIKKLELSNSSMDREKSSDQCQIRKA